MSDSQRIPSIIPTIDPSASGFVENWKNSALQSQGINPSPIEIGSAPEEPAIEVPGAEPVKPLEPVMLIPFDDGTVLKYLPREGSEHQQIIVSARGDQIAIARDESCAAMITDGVNVLFAALDEKKALENKVVAEAIAEANKEPK